MKHFQNKLKASLRGESPRATLKAKLGSLKTKLFATGLVTALVVLLGSGTAGAWGPVRSTFTMKHPAHYITFNSIIDDPTWGDERGFTLIKDVTNIASDKQNTGETAAAPKYTEVATAVNNHVYMVKMLVHNSSADRLKLISNNTRAMISMPTASNTDSAMIQGIVASDNCNADNSGNKGGTCAVWDEAYLRADGKSFKVAYIAGSGRYYNSVRDFKTNGFTLPDSIASKDGAQLGYQAMDGKLQGCFQYSGYLTFLIKVTEEQPKFNLTKQVRVKGDNTWHTSVVAKPGQTLEYRLEYKNVGQTTQQKVVLRDTLAKQTSLVNDSASGTVSNLQGTVGVNYINGSTMLYNANNPKGVKQTNDSWTTKGLMIGDYAKDSNAIVTYQATAPAEDQLQCGDNLLENVVVAFTDDGNKMSTSRVTVKRECTPNQPGKPPVPGAPSAGKAITTAAVSLTLFIICGSIICVVLSRQHKQDK